MHPGVQNASRVCALALLAYPAAALEVARAAAAARSAQAARSIGRGRGGRGSSKAVHSAGRSHLLGSTARLSADLPPMGANRLDLQVRDAAGPASSLHESYRESGLSWDSGCGHRLEHDSSLSSTTSRQGSASWKAVMTLPVGVPQSMSAQDPDQTGEIAPRHYLNLPASIQSTILPFADGDPDPISTLPSSCGMSQME